MFPRLVLAILATASSASAQCNTPAWQTLSYPGNRADHAAAFNPNSGHVMALGGLRGSSALSEVVAWNGASWSTLQSGPSARSAPAMVWDSQRQCAVVFGGMVAANAFLGDTWEWNGSSWSQRIAPGPSPRYGAAHAFASASARMVLFGGTSSAGPQSDTWLWNGAAWVNAGVSGPSPRSHAAMAYDAARQRIILFGGYDASAVRLSDTWLWDGAAWTQAQLPGPPARSNFGMAYDSARQRVVLYGGFSTSAVRLSDTWEWDGAAWTQVQVSGPTPRSSHTLTYDSARARCILIEGVGANATAWASDTWEYDGASWQLVASAVPQNATGRQLISQGAGPALMFGGLRTAPGIPIGVNNETWEWNGLVWKRRLFAAPSASPSARCYSALAYDPLRARAVLFGGTTNITGGLYFADTWEFDGAAWVQCTAPGPSARANASMAFDAARGQVILFGGFTGSAYAADTWAWNGSSWMQLPGGPSGRSGHAMACDQARQRLVMYGGFSGSVFLSDTWELSAGGWSLVSVAGPGPRTSHVMGFDPIRLRTVLFGGFTGSVNVRETWEWDGALWTLTSLSGPIPNIAGGLAWDPIRSRLLCASNISSAGLPTILSTYGADAAPTVSSQPLPVAINVGQTAGFSVGAAGTQPLTFQWRCNAQPLANGPSASGSIISGADSPSLAIAAAQAADAGDYDCIVSNACGSIASAPAALTILCSAPAITLQPLSQTGEVGQTITLSLAASGTAPLRYQWRRAAVPLSDGKTPGGSIISGSAAAALTIQNLGNDDIGIYDCTITNDCGSETSSAAKLEVHCYANCDGSTTPPILTVHDIHCFLIRYAAGDPWANCDPRETRRAPRAADFLCFLQRFCAGCPEPPPPPPKPPSPTPPTAPQRQGPAGTPRAAKWPRPRPRRAVAHTMSCQSRATPVIHIEVTRRTRRSALAPLMALRQNRPATP